MVLTQSPNQPTRAWARAVLQSAQEFGPLPLRTLAGAIPAGLRGSLYRNGPALLARAGQRVGHWFDGDGGILAVHFNEAGAIGVYRYVQTTGYQEEQQAGRFLYGGYGSLAAGPWWQRFSKSVKHAANTSVLALPDRLLALWEGGPPYALSLENLDTIGLDSLGGLQGKPFSAHPKRDPHTGDIFNFGVSLGAGARLNLYRCDAAGQIRQQNTIPLAGLPLIHDFVLAGRYLVFCVPPVQIQALPVLCQMQAFSDAMCWRPEQGTQILVCDRDSLKLVCRLEAEPWYQWHFGNGYELPDGSVVLHIARYADFQTNQRLKEIATGTIQTPARSTLWQLRLDPVAGKLLQWAEVAPVSCEFPVINPQEVGQPCRSTYLVIHQSGTDTISEVFDGLARFDHRTGQITATTWGQGRYPSEPLYAPDGLDPELGWILSVVYNGNNETSELWIYAADQLDGEPVCRLSLPEIVPLGFHGTWQPRRS